MEQTDFLIIGAGVVGLAIAAELSERFDDASIVLMEQHEKYGQEVSSRNSEVIHSGIYYPTGSLKSKLCIEGNKLLYDFCEKWKVPHQRIGKLIIARNENEIPELEQLFKKGNENGVFDLEMLDGAQTKKLEPNLKACAAILSPSTGIIDTHTLMMKLEAISKQGYVLLAYGHEIEGLDSVNDGYIVSYKTIDGTSDKLKTRYLINCAGLNSDKMASMLGINIDDAKYRIYPCKGEYFSIRNSKSNLIKHLIYPPPLKNLQGLGIHITKSLDGNVRLGPNAFYVDELDYTVDIGHSEAFYNAAKDYLPFLEYSDIQTDMAGIRPKIQGPDDSVRDFIIHHEVDKGLPGVINLIGIESPGLTSCLSIANFVAELVKGFDISFST